MGMTALGVFVGIFPCFWDEEPQRWQIIYFNKQGNWQFSSVCESKEEAKRLRAEAHRKHNQLAKERARKAVKEE